MSTGLVQLIERSLGYHWCNHVHACNVYISVWKVYHLYSDPYLTFLSFVQRTKRFSLFAACLRPRGEIKKQKCLHKFVQEAGHTAHLTVETEEQLMSLGLHALLMNWLQGV